MFLLGEVSPTRVATYAYVNPIVALFAGWAIGGERPSPLSLIASVIVIASVATVISSRKPAPEVKTAPLQNFVTAEEI